MRTSHGLDTFERTRILKFHKNTATEFGDARVAVFFKSDELYQVEFSFHRPKKSDVTRLRRKLSSRFGEMKSQEKKKLPSGTPFSSRSVQDYVYVSGDEEADLRFRVDRFESGQVVRSLFLTRRRIESGRTNGAVQLQDDRTIHESGNRATLAFLGSLVFDPAKHPLKELESGDPFAATLRVLKDTDFISARLATPFTSLDTKCTRSQPHYRPEEAESVFKASGIDLFGAFSADLARCGQGPMMDTMRGVQRAGIRTVGVGENFAASRQPVVMTIQGIRVGFLGYLFVDKSSSLSIDSFATEIRPGFAGIDAPLFKQEDAIRTDVRALASEVDVVVVFLERGAPSHACPTQEERRLADAALTAGAALVVGQGGRVPRTIRETVDGLALFSPGVWIDDRDGGASGLAFVVEINRRGVVSYDFLPLVNGGGGPRPLKGEAAKKVMETFSEKWKTCH